MRQNIFLIEKKKEPELFDLVKSVRGWLGIFGEVENSYKNECKPHYIYITIENQLSKGLWGLNIDTKEITKKHSGNVEKIILTNNPLLIKDGVQCLDSEFIYDYIEKYKTNDKITYVNVGFNRTFENVLNEKIIASETYHPNLI